MMKAGPEDVVGNRDLFATPSTRLDMPILTTSSAITSGGPVPTQTFKARRRAQRLWQDGTTSDG